MSMKQLKNRFGLFGLVLIGLMISGCLLISATFIVVASFSFTTMDQHYHYSVDVTAESDWQDHKDQIDNIDAVGLEFYFNNTGASPATFNVYIDDYGVVGDSPGLTATRIINNYTAAPGKTHVTYAQSLKFLEGLDRLKALAKEGKFEYYGVASVGDSLKVDSGKVVITVSASK
jgi:hypothetical protein